MVASVPGLGNVLVNGSGRTLYVLPGEKGGKVTCTSQGNCTTYWPPAVLPSGMAHGIAGAGAQASLLGTAAGPSGEVRLTYGGYPLYTFSGDTGPDQKNGQGFNDSFGTWWALSPSGMLLTSSGSTGSGSTGSTTPTTSAPASGGAGF